MTIIRICLLLIIIIFFLPFFSVSCNSQDKGVNFSAFEISTAKNINGNLYNGNFSGFILIIPPVILFILSFLIYKIKNILIYNICKNIFFILPLFDIFAVFIIKYAFNIAVLNKLGEIPALINIKYGFIFYIIFNFLIFIFAVMNYFIKRE